MSGTMLIGFLAKFSLSLAISTKKRARKIRHTQWIPGKILPHFDPSHLSVGQITKKLEFSAILLAILANKRAEMPSVLPVGKKTRKLGFSAFHWLSWPIRGLGKI